MQKVALFVFNGSPMCFVHVLLNALDLHAKGNEVRIVMEGESTQLVEQLAQPDNWLHGLWQKACAQSLVAGVCKACAQKLGARPAVEKSRLALLDDMNGHPGMAAYRENGYEIITF
ncbi:MAG: cytoplasmic protein [Desulfobacterales bacterium]|nr:cytoplasmic protein [Desulfobacterales bacterium]